MATKQQIPKIAATLVEFQEEFLKLSIEDGQYLIQNTKEAIGLFVSAVQNRRIVGVNPVLSLPILRLIPGGKPIIIRALDGKETISNSEKIFKSGISSDFINLGLDLKGLLASFMNLGLDLKGLATSETPVNVYEMVHDATFIQMFKSFSVDLKKLVMTQHQIIEFCVTHSNWLCPNGNDTFFLTKKDWNTPSSDDNLFVVDVNVYSGGLRVHVSRFEDKHCWRAKFIHRVVTPQIMV